jgi:hypothetical protein
LTLDEKGIPAEASARVEIAYKIVERAEALGIPREDVIIDCLTLSLGANVQAGLASLEATRRVRDELGVNQTQGSSNISHAAQTVPRSGGGAWLLALGHRGGAQRAAPPVDLAQVDLVAVLGCHRPGGMGRDNYAMRFISCVRIPLGCAKAGGG